MTEHLLPRIRSDARIEAFLRETETRLRRLNQVLVDLAMRPVIHSGDLDLALREITAATAHALDVERVSVWFFTQDRSAIRCASLYEREPDCHSGGAELKAADYPDYFSSLQMERTITAHDAQHDPRTSAFAAEYLKPLGITSMVDAPIRRLGQVSGVVCHEHVGIARHWTTEEENFASSIADLVVMAVDASERRQTQEILRHRLAYEKLISSISSHLINVAPGEVDAAITDALGAICRFAGADRGHVVLISEDGATATLTHEWCREGVASRRDAITHIPVGAFQWTHDALNRYQSIALRSLDDLPSEAAAERELQERFGTKSLVAVPLIANRALMGFVGVHSVGAPLDVSEESTSLLKTIGEIFVATLQRTRAEHALRKSEQLHRLLFERNVAGVYRTTLSGRFIDCNAALARLLGFSSREELLEANAHDFYFSTQDRTAFVEQLRAHGSLPDFELRLRRRDGQSLWVLESVHLVDEPGSEPVIEGTIIDITGRKEAEEALRESEARYRLMADNATDLIARTNPRGRFLYASPAVRSLLGYEPAEMIGRSIFEFVTPEDHEVLRRTTALVERGEPITFTYRVVRRDQRVTWFESTSRAIFDEERKIVEVVSVSRDVSERKVAEEQIEYQAYHDTLTGLPNRLLFRDRLTVALAHARRMRTPLAVMFLDLDSFKFVNDTLGHSIGDELLKIIAGRLAGALREEDTIARMGGDEFTVLLANLASLDDASAVAQKLLAAIAEPMRVEGHELFITTSIGIALYPADGENAESLLKSADNAMYRAKEIGRNSYQLCTPAMNRRAVERLSTENALRRAIDRGEFLLHYQPQVQLATGTMVGVEALLRWNRPDRGFILPTTFISIAEESRLILPLGEWVLREACRQARAWQERHRGLRMAVNLSARQFQHADLRNMISSALEETGLDPRVLEIEITETTAMLNTERTVAMLKALRDMGVSIAIDDFGTGHSSLNYLRDFPIDAVKIDQAFVSQIESSRSDRAIVAAVIEMAHGLGLRVTAEGVETRAQMEFLLHEGCEEVQGYLFGRPLPADALG